MRWSLFYHSLVSDWNHGNAHFLRGIASELLSRAEEVAVYEPSDSWSRANLRDQHGPAAVESYQTAYPDLTSHRYDLDSLDLDRELAHTDVVIAHEWNDPELIRRLGQYRRRHDAIQLLFHDTHHRIVTAPEQMRRFDLRHFDGVLAYGRVIRDLYTRGGWHDQAWTWHEAADVRVFHPQPRAYRAGDLVWIGNWGDEERSEELQEFLLGPVGQLGLSAEIYGVRYPEAGQAAVAASGAQYRGWLANHRVPEVFSRFDLTIHVPRRPYRERLPGIPTIRVFEALACGIPMITAPWNDTEDLFRPGRDYLVARDGADMRKKMQDVLADANLRADLGHSGLESIRARHTCAHRVDQLMTIVDDLRRPAPRPAADGRSGQSRHPQKRAHL